MIESLDIDGAIEWLQQTKLFPRTRLYQPLNKLNYHRLQWITAIRKLENKTKLLRLYMRDNTNRSKN